MTTAQNTVRDEILATEITAADVAAARAFIERFQFNATAVYALSVALDELNTDNRPEWSAVVEAISGAVNVVAEAESYAV